jgi:hypothetical protein
METLECRKLLCGATWDVHHEPPVELAPETIDRETGISPPSMREVADPANIVWTNRGQASDGFAARFGTSANLARNVVDAVIIAYERMIGSFDYSSAGQVYNLTVSMGASGSGFGASASLGSSLGGKPKSGSITLGGGNGSADPNDDNGWFLDPTPAEHSEFLGSIQHAFAGDAQSGSPALGKSDFYTVVALELAHCMGLFGNALAGWHNRTTNTGITDTTAGPPGFYWVFDGPSIKHLLTSNNAGTQDWGSAVHSAEGGANINFNNLNWRGTHDIGNAFYEGSRRYLVNNAFALMFKDAYGYLVNNPARDGTFYSVLNQTTGQVTVRGGAGNSADNIQIFRSSGNTLTVAVDLGDDIPGTGALPGAGNLPAFTTVYDLGEVTSIVVNTGGGDDVIFIDDVNFDSGAIVNKPITINGEGGNDSLTIGFFAQNLDSFTGALTFSGGTGTDSIVVYDNGATFSDTYTITNSALTRIIFGGLSYSTTESLFLNGQTGNNIFNVNSTPSGMSFTLDGRNGNDQFNLLVSGTPILGPVSVIGGTGADTLLFNDTAGVSEAYLLSSNQVSRTGAATISYDTTVENLTIDGGTGDNLFLLDAPPTTTVPTLLINGNGGNDSLSVTLSDSNLGFGGTFNGGTGGDGIDVLDLRSTVFVGLHSNSFLGGTIRQHNYSGVESLTYTGGGGNDSFNVFSTSAATTIHAEGGNDTISLGLLGSALDNIAAPVTVNGGAGTDSVFLRDETNTLPRTYHYTGTSASGNVMAQVSYPAAEVVTHFGGSGADTLNVNGTTPGTLLTIRSGSGADLVNVVETTPNAPVVIDGQTGLDSVQINSDGVGSATAECNVAQTFQSLQILNGGTLIMPAGGNRLLQTRSLFIGATGALDLSDNDMIVDFSGGPSPLTTITGWINSGRQGNWTGFGIRSTSARFRPFSNTTLGVLPSSQYRAIYTPSTPFSGVPTNNNMVLVKYTYYGDTDFNGVVDFDDYARIDIGFLSGASGWLWGDSDLGGSVDFDDYANIDNAFLTQTEVL